MWKITHLQYGALDKKLALSGDILFAGENLVGMSEKRYQRIRGEGIGMIFRAYDGA